MDFRKLLVFCKVFELKSFSKAAKQTHLTQPSVSGYIASLESLLATTLFDRHKREVTPTQAGRLFYGYAKDLLAMKEEAVNEINLFLGRKRGSLSLGGSTIPGQYILPNILGQFKTLYPEVKIYLHIRDTQQIIELILQEKIEMGAVGAKIDESKLIFMPFTKDELVLAIPTSYYLPKKEKSPFAILKGIPFIMREDGSGTRIAIERFLNQKGIDINNLNVVAELGSTEAVRQAIINGIGVSILSKRAIEVELKAGLIKVVSFDKKPMWRDFYLVYPKGETLSPLAKAFLEFAQKIIQREQ
jgi:DNA-binding transcriptional LysR family regulator